MDVPVLKVVSGKLVDMPLSKLAGIVVSSDDDDPKVRPDEGDEMSDPVRVSDREVDELPAPARPDVQAGVVAVMLQFAKVLEVIVTVGVSALVPLPLIELEMVEAGVTEVGPVVPILLPFTVTVELAVMLLVVVGTVDPAVSIPPLVAVVEFTAVGDSKLAVELPFGYMKEAVVPTEREPELVAVNADLVMDANPVVSALPLVDPVDPGFICPVVVELPFE
ncbi:hypothetical protein GGR50DRAFT_691824 [Xylaria sp. CBS 124048]|nr:hypothetical protein GGR50DRAFT_691824 [Xylaria sp. CBS 124048]